MLHMRIAMAACWKGKSLTPWEQQLAGQARHTLKFGASRIRSGFCEMWRVDLHGLLGSLFCVYSTLTSLWKPSFGAGGRSLNAKILLFVASPSRLDLMERMYSTREGLLTLSSTPSFSVRLKWQASMFIIERLGMKRHACGVVALRPGVRCDGVLGARMLPLLRLGVLIFWASKALRSQRGMGPRVRLVAKAASALSNVFAMFPVLLSLVVDEMRRVGGQYGQAKGG